VDDPQQAERTSHVWQATPPLFFRPPFAKCSTGASLLANEHTPFPVDLVETATVHQLKEIKANNQDLKNLVTHYLTLYRVEVDESCACGKKKRINELKRLSQHVSECTGLDKQQELLVYFDGAPSPGKKHYVLVYAPRVSPYIMEPWSLCRWC